MKGSDLVVEAVFENREIKAEVTKQAEAQLADGAVFGSNTSTLPITGLAEASVRPGELHRHPLLLAGRQDDAGRDHPGREDLARRPWPRRIDYVMKIKKTPIVVNDSRGFYTSRCFAPS